MERRKDNVGSRSNLASLPPPAGGWEDLVARTARGDHDALAALYDGTCTLVHSLVVRIVGDHHIAEEVTADVYLQVWRQAERYDPERGSPLAWLMMIARSRGLDRVRARAAEPRHMEPLAVVMSLPSAMPDPEETSALSQRRRAVGQALETLPLEQREVIELAYFGGLSHSEIAARLAQPLGTVKTRVRVGMIRLRQELGSASRETL
jgi:RNA polymerase sigma-70 factor (ECF subfamily)